MPTFTPPTRTFVPTIIASTPADEQSPMKFWTPSIPIGVNVWLDTANAISETQPPLWEKRLNADGTTTPGVQKVWYGGHGPYTITDAEKVVLTAAGYGSSITG